MGLSIGLELLLHPEELHDPCERCAPDCCQNWFSFDGVTWSVTSSSFSCHCPYLVTLIGPSTSPSFSSPSPAGARLWGCARSQGTSPPAESTTQPPCTYPQILAPSSHHSSERVCKDQIGSLSQFTLAKFSLVSLNNFHLYSHKTEKNAMKSKLHQSNEREKRRFRLFC